MEPMQRTVVVVGGGVAGLTVAYELAERSQRLGDGVRVLCLESSDRPGGNIRSERVGGFTCEAGPTGFLDNAPATITLARRLGLADRMIRAKPEAANRYIFRRGKLRKVPLNPISFLGSGILSPLGKLRLLGEPFAPRSKQDDESIFEFASRRIGREAAAVLVDAMVSGVYAGNARQLSLPATFPKMRNMEQQHGSLFRAMLAKRKEAKSEGSEAGGPAGPGGVLTSFRDGLEELTNSLARALSDKLRLNSPVQLVSDMGRRGFRVLLDEGAPIEANAVVLACPAWTAAPLVESMDPKLHATMTTIPSASLAVVHTGFRTMALGDQLTGFGYLVPREQGPRVLGTLWISQIFDGRAPDGAILLTSMIGGAHDPHAVDLDDEAMLAVVRDDINKAMSIMVRPYFSHIVRWPRGIPQYTLGHPERMQVIEDRLRDHPGLYVSGNSYRGISVNACVEEAPQVAEAVLEFLNVRTDDEAGESS
jgi:oxygen-dependent protoporphyrinogen oxidase